MSVLSDNREKINRVVPIETLGNLLGYDWSRRKSIFCPFHDNSRTMAAKVFPDTNTIYCYAEQKVYTSVDVMVKLLGWSVGQILEYSKQFDDDLARRTPTKKKLPKISTEGKTLLQIVTECDEAYRCV